MKKTGLERMLCGYARKRPLRLHMPGHKAGRAFSRRFPMAAADITELSFSDSLHRPEGVIAAAEKHVGEILGAKKCFFLTDGSTCGVFSMVYAAKRCGRKELVVCRNSHQSVYNACKALGVEPVVVAQRMSDGVPLPPDPREIGRALREHPAADVLLTYPDYYGRRADIAAIKAVCVSLGRRLFADGAHGGHLRFFAPAEYVGAYADMWVDGVHKTLPCLTQTALLCVSDGALLSVAAEAAGIFRTSSPSYPLMASVEYGETFMAEKGEKLLSSLERELALFKRRLRAGGYGVFETGDPLKLCVDFAPAGISPDAAEEFLQKKGVYAEMNDGRRLLFLLGVTTKKRHLARLWRALNALMNDRALQGACAPPSPPETGTRRTPYLEACAAESECVPIPAAVGRVLAENAGVFPPCWPLCVAGETMTETIAAALQRARCVFGADGGTVKVIKKVREDEER